MTTSNASNQFPQDIDTHQIPVTFFDDQFAAEQWREQMTLPELAEEIRWMTDSSKKKLPWLKLATFGDVASAKNCLRTNENTQSIGGVEVDYDAGETTFDGAVARLKAAGLRALVYTSASHKAGVKEKWRVLCPTSRSRHPDDRKALVSWLNGVLGGGIDPASFNLSIAFYYGSVKDNPEHRVEVVDGDFIDERLDLAEGAIEKPAAVKRDTPLIGAPITGQSSPGYSDEEINRLLDRSQYKNSDGSGNWHPNMLAVTGALVGRGLGNDAIAKWVEPYCLGGWDDEEMLAMVASARAKWGIPDPDIEAGAKLGPDVLAAIAADAPAVERIRSATLDDFQAYLPTHHCVYMPTRAMWPVASVDDVLPKIQLFDADGTAKVNSKGKPVYTKPSVWLAQHRPLEQMTWMPGEAEIIRDRFVLEGGWVDHTGARCLNLYRPPTLPHGDAALAGRWIDHVERLYGDDALHLIKWLAFKVQKPGVKINHSVVLGGPPGIGKDTLLEPVKQAVGPWNVAEIAPKDMLERFNGYGQAVIIRISEARDLGEMSRYEFYERTKVYGAAPPDVLMIDEKNLKKYAVPNVCNMVITTNYKTNGIYLPGDDRRHFVAWSDLTKETFPAGYWPGLWGWYEAGGAGHVASYLMSLNLSDFNPKAPPPLTGAFHAIVDANQSPESGEMSDILTRSLGNPAAVTLAQIQNAAEYEFQKWLQDRKNQRQVIHRLEDCGYEALRSDAKDRQWVVGGKRQAIYVVAMLSTRDKLKAAAELCSRGATEKKLYF